MALSAEVVARVRARRALVSRLRRPKPLARVDAPRWPRGARTQYLLALSSVLSDLRRLVEAEIVPALPGLLADAEVNRRDAPSDELGRLTTIVRALAAEPSSEARARGVAQRVGVAVAKFGRSEQGRVFVQAAGFDPLPTVEPYLDEQIALFVRDNVRLIQGLSREALDDVERIVTEGVRSGARVERIREQLRERWGISKRRAALIAEDQVSKLNGELTRRRHAEVGVEGYVWSTSKDERVRSGHRALEGTRQRWSEPPIVDTRTGKRAHPGQDIRCRCAAIPIVDEILRAVGAEPPGEPPGRQPRRRRRPARG